MTLVQPNGAFEWVQEAWGPALRCAPLSRIARHLFSTRHLEVPGARDEAGQGWEDLAEAVGVKSGDLVRLRQVHEASQWFLGPSPGSAGPELVDGSTGLTIDPEPAERVERRDGRLILDLWRATRDQLLRAGLAPEHIHVSELCTASHPELFHSYRRDGKAAGRLVAMIKPR